MKHQRIQRNLSWQLKHLTGEALTQWIPQIWGPIQEIQTTLEKLENVIDCKFKDVKYFLKKSIEETEERKLEKLDYIHKIVLELIQEKNNQTPP